MVEHQFHLTQQMLNQLRQPVLFAQEEHFTHCNQAASPILQLGSQNVPDYLSEAETEAYLAMEVGESLTVSLQVCEEFCQATITKTPAYAVFILQDKPNDDHLSLDMLPSLAYAIRDPLSQIFSAMDALIPILEEEENPTIQSITSQANRGLYRLLRLSANMFDYPLYINDERTLNIEKIDITEYFQRRFMELESMASNCDITLNTQLDAKNLIGYFDGQQIYRMILNMVSNAITATSAKDTIDLRVTTKGQMLQIRVADKGQGIPPEILSTMFNRFESGNVHVKNNSAAGFGLPMARQIAMAHGGNLIINTALNKGTMVIATAKINQKQLDLSSPTAKVDYTGGLNICQIELSEVLPNSDFDSRSI